MDEASFEQPDGAGHGSASSFDLLLERLERIVAAENADLAAHDYSRIVDSAKQKTYLLLELNRTPQDKIRDRAGRGLKARLEQVRLLIASNERCLKLHLKAARELSDVVSDAIREDESDGTYSLGMLS